MHLPLHLRPTTIYPGVPYLLADSGLAAVLRVKHAGPAILSATLDDAPGGVMQVAMTLASPSTRLTHLAMEAILRSDEPAGRLIRTETWTDYGSPIDVPRKNLRKKPRIEYPEIQLRLYSVDRINPAD